MRQRTNKGLLPSTTERWARILHIESPPMLLMIGGRVKQTDKVEAHDVGSRAVRCRVMKAIDTKRHYPVNCFNILNNANSSHEFISQMQEDPRNMLVVERAE